MTQNAPCPLCEEHDAHVIQTIPAARIVEAYRDELGVRCELPAADIFYLDCGRCGLRFFTPAVTGDEAFYAQLQKIPWYYSAAKQEFRIAASHVRASDNVLEIGAGRGLFSREIACASYTGLEFSSTAIQLAAADGVRLLPQSIEEHAQQNAGRYDVVCAFQVLEHVAQPRSFLDAAVRCLKPGGRLIVSTPGEDSFARDANRDVLNMPPHHVTRWTDASLRSIARLCGLKVLTIAPEPLGRNMRRAYAQATADRWLAGKLGFEPRLLDQRLQSPLFRAFSPLAAAFIRKSLSVVRRERRGHAVVAVFERLRAE